MANNIISALRQAVYTKATSNSNAFVTSINSRLFYIEAPEDVASPYCVFTILPINTDKDSGNKFYEAIVQFNVYAVSPTESETIAEKLIGVFENQPITITGFSFIRSDKQPVENLGKTDNLYEISVPYLIEFQG